MSDDDYLELLEDARSALYDLIKMTEPGTGLPLHHAYSDIKRSIERQTRQAVADAPDPAKEERDRINAEYREAKEAWRLMPWHERERLLLDALGGDSLTKGEIVKRINEARDDLSVWDSNIANLLTRMLAAREIDRERDQFGKTGTRWRWRYFRNNKLDGAIADLNEQMEA